MVNTCSYTIVVSGDSCASLASRCGITAAELTTYNPSSTLCSTLAINEVICCSSGAVPDLTPQPNADGTCASYTVVSGDYCDLIASNNYITSDDIESFNTQTWGWNGCADLQLGASICLSSGDPPMPAQEASYVCGPQVVGTERPSDWSDISSLNPCPLNACCDIWGQCGITPDFCTPTNSTTGAPGTAAAGSNGCISNCGIDIINNDEAPAEFISVGYFEAFGANRSCLNMDASQLPSTYSTIHYAFGSITTDFQVDLSEYIDQFTTFAASTGFKRVLSFGGWSFSTDVDSYPIFRDGVTDANRQTFAQSVVDTVNQYDLDGVDFDWEYPGATDIPGIPPGSPTDGTNYLSFLQDLRAILPTEKTISIAAPASYWYLRGFPIANMSEVLDYIVYMTYDMHGQWDYGSTSNNPGCPTGNCLRSHVNLTETEYALSMITKAGVPANKVVVGIAGYGRSFGMVDPSCTGPECLFTGPDSTATVGLCTDTAGYISQAELESLSAATSSSKTRRDDVVTASWHDDSSDSDMMTYGDGSWVAYMSAQTKASRIGLYAGYNFAGSVEWAIDLVQFVVGEDAAVSALDVATLESEFDAGLLLSNYDMTQFADTNLTDLATRLVGWDKCSIDNGFNPAAIYSGWQQSWKIMNQVYAVAKAGINFNEAGAVEFLGPPGGNQGQQSAFKQIFLNLATIQPGYITTPFDWRIAVRCDDWLAACSCGTGGNTIAYTVQKDPKYQTASINFCPTYFTQSTLDTLVAKYSRDSDLSVYADMTNYQGNQGRTWIHELLHIDWVSLARNYGSNTHVTDIKMYFKDRAGSTVALPAYGASLTKSLSRFWLSPGVFTVANADSLTMYALAQYIQKILGNIYPHLPLAPQPPSSVDFPVVVDGYFTVYPNDTFVVDPDDVANDTAVNWDPSTQGVCAEVDDMDDDDSAAAVVTLAYSGFGQQSAYPTDYLSSWSSWAGLLPTTTTAAPSPTASATWTIAIYSEADCAGDYYSLEGHNIDSFSDTCLVLRGGSLSQDDGNTPTSNSCRWFTEGGAVYADCSTSTLTQPLSWEVRGGVCTAYDNDSCDLSAGSDAYTSGQGCHNYESSLDDTKTWVALQCGAEVSDGPLAEFGGLNSPVGSLQSTTITTAVSVSAHGNHSNATRTTMTKAYDPVLLTTLATATTKS